MEQLLFFFFQAEDGIRDDLVTGVQTCALPITDRSRRPDLPELRPRGPDLSRLPRQEDGRRRLEGRGVRREERRMDRLLVHAEDRVRRREGADPDRLAEPCESLRPPRRQVTLA